MNNNEDSIKEECIDLKDTKLKIDWKRELTSSICVAIWGIPIEFFKLLFLLLFRYDIAFDKIRDFKIILKECATYGVYAFIMFWIIILALFTLCKIFKIIYCHLEKSKIKNKRGNI